MSQIPTDLKYVKSHEWIRLDGDDTVTVGITHHAQELLGDLVFVELPEVDSGFSLGDDIAVVESVKAASDVYSPLTGEVVAINDAVEATPELVNSDPYGEGWLFQMKITEKSQLDDLLDAEAYSEIVESESH